MSAWAVLKLIGEGVILGVKAANAVVGFVKKTGTKNETSTQTATGRVMSGVQSDLAKLRSDAEGQSSGSGVQDGHAAAAPRERGRPRAASSRWYNER